MAIRPGGGIGRHKGLRSPRRKACRFESCPGHQATWPSFGRGCDGLATFKLEGAVETGWINGTVAKTGPECTAQ